MIPVDGVKCTIPCCAFSLHLFYCCFRRVATGYVYRRSYKSDHVLLNLLNVLGRKIRNEALHFISVFALKSHVFMDVDV